MITIIHQHVLKCQQPFFDSIWNRIKLFEYRLNDRDFHVSDYVLLREYDEASDTFSQRSIRGRITYMLTSKELPTLPDRYCILQLSELRNYPDNTG